MGALNVGTVLPPVVVRLRTNTSKALLVSPEATMLLACEAKMIWSPSGENRASWLWLLALLVPPLLPPEAGVVPVVATEATAAPNSVVEVVKEAGVFVVPVVPVVPVAMVVRVALEGRDALPVKARKVRGKGSPPGHTSP